MRPKEAGGVGGRAAPLPFTNREPSELRPNSTRIKAECPNSAAQRRCPAKAPGATDFKSRRNMTSFEPSSPCYIMILMVLSTTPAYLRRGLQRVPHHQVVRNGEHLLRDDFRCKALKP